MPTSTWQPWASTLRAVGEHEAIALTELPGILVGEQIVPSVKRMITGEPITTAWLRHDCVAYITGVETAPAGSDVA